MLPSLNYISTELQEPFSHFLSREQTIIYWSYLPTTELSVMDPVMILRFLGRKTTLRRSHRVIGLILLSQHQLYTLLRLAQSNHLQEDTELHVGKCEYPSKQSFILQFREFKKKIYVFFRESARSVADFRHGERRFLKVSTWTVFIKPN